ncbi:unnamed protein product [Caenorhabditis angaria]|uniref:HECT-type E3 ubiquitin transferase n=1 Tax=Caenorhabditis angaria TaxID=860376 RepID=A0A9P1I8J8_9PELO|nr:unnamed protein product [Caenorhabditis angaria]
MSLNFAFFNGEVTRDRKQEAFMRSLNERNNFLEHLNNLSEQRNLEDKKNRAAKLVQKKWREYWKKQEKRKEYRQRFDNMSNDVAPGNGEMMAKLLVNFYEQKMDEERLIICLNEIIKTAREQPSVIPKILPNSRRICLTKCCLKFMRSATSQTNFFMILRFLESFVINEQKLFEIAVKIGFFEAQIALLNAVNEPKMEKIGEKIGMRAQQKSISIHSPLIYQKFIESATKSAPDLIFFNILLPQFAQSITPEKSAFPTFFVGQKYSEEISQYFDALAGSSCAENLAENHGNGMETENLVDSYLKERIETILESAKFRRIAQSYANLNNVNVITIVSLQRQFLRIVDSLAASENFMNSLWDYIRKSIDDRGFFDEKCTDIEFLISALILFCGCVKNRISSITDSEFQPDIIIPNFVGVLYLLRDTCLKLINLVHPDFPGGAGNLKLKELEARLEDAKKKWQEVCDAVVTTLQAVHEKDERLKFLTEKFWSDHDRNVVITKWDGDFVGIQRRRIGRGANNQNEDSTFVQQLLADYDSDSSSSSSSASDDEHTGISRKTRAKTLTNRRP